MSDVVIVSADAFRNGIAPEGHVPYGTVFADSDDAELVEPDGRFIESFYDGAVPAIDWSGRDVPVKRGRPKKFSEKGVD